MPSVQVQLPDVGLRRMADILGLSAVRVDQLVKQGHVPALETRTKGGSLQFNITATVQAYVRYLKAEDRKNSKSTTQSRVQTARASSIELRVARESGQVVELEEVLGILDEVVGGIRSGMIGVPARFTRDLDERKKLEGMVNDVFESSADRFEQASRSLRESGKADSSATADES